jgi:hypothetical protein
MQAETRIRGQELAEGREIKVHDHRVALGRVNLDGGSIFREGRRRIFEGQGGAGKNATTVIALKKGMAARRGGNDHLILLKNAKPEIAPEVRRTKEDSLG